MEEIQAKGLAFVSVLGAIEELRSRAFRDRVLEAMPEESRAALRYGSVIASGWYPIGWYRELFGAAVALAQDSGFSRELGRTSIRREITGVHRLLFKVVSVETLQKHSARLFRSYFQPGEVRVERFGPGLGRTYWRGCDGFDKNLWMEQVGCVEELLVQSGVKLPRVRVLNGGDNADNYMELETRWM
jgi:hypothetical protein